jgi:uncharacterized protein (DUF2236 family)
MLGGPRALLMQIAHPSVAAAVTDHSGFPDQAYQRLWRTLDAMLTISFGDREQSAEAAERVTAVHRRVIGATPGGDPYDALDPDLLLWVHATGVDSALVTYRMFVSELTRNDRERYYDEMKRQAVALEVPPSAMPESLPEFDRYVEKTCRTLEVNEQARTLARDILSPPVPLPLRPVARYVELVTTALLPAAVGEKYGLRRSGVCGLATRASARAIRMILPLVPDLARRWPHARAAAERVTAPDPVEQFAPD